MSSGGTPTRTDLRPPPPNPDLREEQPWETRTVDRPLYEEAVGHQP